MITDSLSLSVAAGRFSNAGDKPSLAMVRFQCLMINMILNYPMLLERTDYKMYRACLAEVLVQLKPA